MEATQGKFKPKEAEKADVATIGQWIAATEKHCTLFPATMQHHVSAVRKLAGVIRIEATEHFRPKSEDSTVEVDLDPELVPLLRGWRAAAKGEFVIEGKDNTDFKSRVSYRCEGVYVVL